MFPISSHNLLNDQYLLIKMWENLVNELVTALNSVRTVSHIFMKFEFRLQLKYKKWNLCL